MFVMSSTETKRVWGQVIEKAQRAPVVVQKDGRPAVAVISYEDFERFREFEDKAWGERAKAVREKGEYVGTDKGAELLNLGLAE